MGVDAALSATVPPGGYVELARRYPRLTPEAEAELFRRGDRDAILLHHLRDAVILARGYRRHTDLPLEDLVGHAVEGLIEAYGRFEPGRGARFSTYAGYWVRERIRRALVESRYPIRLPWHVVKALRRDRRLGEDGPGSTGPFARGVLSLDESRDLVAPPGPAGDVVADPAPPFPEFFAGLCERDRLFLRWRLLEGWTLKQCGVALGLTPGGVASLQHRLLTRVRKRFPDATDGSS